jgi:hypothetical protein
MYKQSHFNWRAAISGSLLAAALTACGGADYDASPASLAAPESYQVTLTGDQEAPAAIATAARGGHIDA